MKKRTILSSLLLIFLIMACNVLNPDNENNSDDTDPNQNTHDPVTFTLVNGAEPASLDPAMISGTVENRIYLALFEGLVTYDYQTARAIPGVAESWTVSDDNTVYTFNLRQTTWSDGTAITAQTFVDSWLRTLNPSTGAPYAWFPSMFLEGGAAYNAGESTADNVGVRAINDYTLEVTLIGPLPYALDAFAHYSFGIVPLHIINQYGDSWTDVNNIITNGPYTLKEWIPEDKIIVEKSTTYWDKTNVNVDEITYLSTLSNLSAYSMFLDGEVDWSGSGVTSEALLRDDVHISQNLATYYYVLNHEVEPLNDVRVRKALSMSIDRDYIVEDITGAGQIPTTSMVPDMDGYESVIGNEYNVEAAQTLLADAGYPNGEGFPELPILYNTSYGHQSIAEFIQEQWSTNLGISTTLTEQDWGDYLETKRNHEFSIARAGWGGDYQDPNTFLDMFVTGAEMNDMLYSNPTYDSLILQAATMENGSERYDILRQAETILVKDDQALIPLYTYVKVNCIDLTKWGGWASNVLDIHPVKSLYKR